MKKNVILLFAALCAIILWVSCSNDDSNEIIRSSETIPPSYAQKTIPFYNSLIYLVDKKRGKTLLGTSDDFTKSLSVFDIQSRLNSTTIAGTETEYLNFTTSQISDWSATELVDMATSIAECEKKLKNLGVNFNDLPPVIEFVKTTGEEEFGAEGYTRGKTIALKTNDVGTIAHELFHVFTRNNPTKADKIYGIYSFKKSSNRLTYPSSIVKVTNPDAPFYDYYITLNYKGNTIQAVPFIYSINSFSGWTSPSLPPIVDNAKYVQGVVNPIVAQVEYKGGKWVFSSDSAGKPIFIPFEQTDIYTYIGKNTIYVFHQEELAAKSFEMLTLGQTGPNPELLTSLLNEMKK